MSPLFIERFPGRASATPGGAPPTRPPTCQCRGGRPPGLAAPRAARAARIAAQAPFQPATLSRDGPHFGYGTEGSSSKVTVTSEWDFSLPTECGLGVAGDKFRVADDSSFAGGAGRQAESAPPTAGTQAGSEPCLSPGDWRGRSVGSEEAGREGTAPKSFTVADADAVCLAEGSIRTTATARSLGAAGGPSPGSAFTGIPPEPGRPPVSSRETSMARLTAKGPAPAGRDAPASGNEQASTERYRAVEGDRRRPGWAGRSLTTLLVPGKVGNWAEPGPTRGKGGSSPPHGSRETCRSSEAEPACQRNSATQPDRRGGAALCRRSLGRCGESCLKNRVR